MTSLWRVLPPVHLDGNEVNMNSKLIALASAATIAVTAAAIPNQAEARWRGGGWWVPGAVVGGLALGAAIASRPYYYGGGPYYAYGGNPYYGGGPYYGSGSYYGGGPYYGGGAYYGGGPYYAYGGSPYYGDGYYRRPYRNWREF
jgi:hypothetical protein